MFYVGVLEFFRSSAVLKQEYSIPLSLLLIQQSHDETEQLGRRLHVEDCYLST